MNQQIPADARRHGESGKSGSMARQWISRFITLSLCLIAGAAISVVTGEDSNWDLLNYHLYNGFAFLHGRFGRDVLAAGMQSSLNPVLDALYTGLALGPLHHAPRTLAAVTGLWYGGIVFVAILLSTHIGQAGATTTRIALAAMAAGVALSVTGAATVAQIGTSTEEVQVALVMLAGLLALVIGRAGAAWPVMVGGGLFGLAAGLKLTAVAYGPAALLAALIMSRERGHGRASSVVTVSLFLVAWVSGFLIVDGWWAALLLHRYHSPTFPMFNGLSRSVLYPPASVIDGRFFPHGPVQWMFYPLWWARGGSATVNELPLRDPRLALALILGVLAIGAGLGRRRGEPLLTRVQAGLLAFLMAGYVTWLMTSSILRYAVVLEVVAGLLAPALLVQLFRCFVRPSAMLVIIGVVTGTVLVTTRYPTTSRIPYGAKTIDTDIGEVLPNTLLILSFRGPVSYLVPFLPHQDSLRVINVGDTLLEARGWGLHDHAVRLVREHSGPIKVLTDGNPLGQFPELGEIGISPSLIGCRLLSSSFAPAREAGTHLCDGHRAEWRALPSRFWAQAARRYRTLVQIGDPTQSLIGAAYLAAAAPEARGTHIIDWTDLLWSGVGSHHDVLPEVIDPASLYVLPESVALAAASRSDPARDLLARIDGQLVLAPGWRNCADCMSTYGKPASFNTGLPLQLGDRHDTFDKRSIR